MMLCEVEQPARARASRAEDRRQLRAAIGRLAEERKANGLMTLAGDTVAGGTAREAAALTQMSLAYAQQELDNMRRRGEIVVLGHVRSPRGNRPSVVYGPVAEAAPMGADLPGLAMLDTLMRQWPRVA